MLKISPETIKEIAEQLDCGMKCFYHLPTGELVTYPDELKWGGEIDEEVWGEDLAKIDENFHEYVAFTAMESHESFGVMEDFIEMITEQRVRESLKKSFNAQNLFNSSKTFY
ncbi:MAG: hypothetical protein M3Z56_07250 [Bacteroidota bacterium]|nr:hypothetical protein [Bacteroidota bacterium]